MKSPESARSGRALRTLRDKVDIVLRAMAAIHGFQDAIASRLHRQVQIGHHFRIVAMLGDQIVVHVARMAGHVAQADR